MVSHFGSKIQRGQFISVIEALVIFVQHKYIVLVYHFNSECFIVSECSYKVYKLARTCVNFRRHGVAEWLRLGVESLRI